MATPSGQTTTYYTLLGVQPAASVQRIRQAYRDMSKLYHPAGV
jgi:DnaJ-class molecular chaperone